MKDKTTQTKNKKLGMCTLRCSNNYNSRNNNTSNSTKSKSRREITLHLPSFRIGGINLSGKVDVLPGLGSRLLLVTQVGHEQFRKSNVSC